VAIAVAIAIIIAIVLLLRRSADKPETGSSEEDLLRLCHGDRAQMERLIALETRNAPDLPRSAAVARAAYSLRRDSR
jgi:hypothetical protein